MKTEGKIIVLFLEDKQPRTIRELSKAIRSDYKITHTAVQNLVSKKLILAKTVGKSTLCMLNDSYYGIEIYEAENRRKDMLFKNNDLKQLYKEIMGKLKHSLFIFLLFGSYAKGISTSSSDIDILFISNDADLEQKVLNILSLLPLKTHLLVFREEEFIRMKDSKESNIVKEAIVNNILLYGIESYYRLKNA